MFAALVLLAFVAVVADARADVLSGEDLRKLLAGGPEGTTILFQGGTDKVFYSAALKNRLRRSPQLGVDFLKQKVQPNTVSEGVFISATIDNGKWRMITGIAAVAADHDSGHGVLTMIQTFPEDSTINAGAAIQRHNKSAIIVCIIPPPIRAPMMPPNPSAQEGRTR